MSHKNIRKAIFPVAGLGTRFLPATKANPKEILPIVDKPLIQYAVEEAIAAGIQELIFVTSSAKRAIEDHFDRNVELEYYLEQKGNQAKLDVVRNVLPEGVMCVYIRQSEPKGLGHAIWCARELIGDEPFAVLLADDLIDGKGMPCLSQMTKVYDKTGGNVMATQTVPLEDVSKYGIVSGEHESERLIRIAGLVEKPEPKQAPSQQAVIGRYILQSGIFKHLEKIKPGRGGEIQLTDAIAAMIDEVPSYAYAFEGERFDCGSKLGYVEATLAFALKDPAIGSSLRERLNDVLEHHP